MTRRQDRVADVVRARISQILLRDVQDPRVRLASVTQVRMSPDLRHARVGISVLGSDEERRQAMQALRRAGGYLRRRLAEDLKSLRAIPELEFQLDRGAEHSQHISDLLDHIDESPEG